MQKGMEMNLIVAMILALVGVSFFIAMTNGDIKQAAASIYCKTFFKSSASDSGASVPDMCKGASSFNVQQIQSTDSRVFSRQLLSYIIACWKQSDGLKVQKTYACFEVHLPGNVANVTEASLSDVLNREDHCRSIENSDFGCGVMDQISWQVEGNTIKDQTILFIDYDPAKDVIVVTG